MTHFKKYWWVYAIIIVAFGVLWFRKRKCESETIVNDGEPLPRCNFFTGKRILP